MLNKFILSISSDLEDPAYAERILQEYIDFFHLDRAHFASIRPNGVLEIDYYVGWNEFIDVYRQYEEYDIWKPENMPVPMKAESFTINIKTYRLLARENPLYAAISTAFKPASMLSAIHPSCTGLCGMRLDSDIRKEKLQYHETISPLITICYYHHTRMLKSRDMTAFLGDRLFRERLCTVIDEKGTEHYAHPEFMNEIHLRGLEWKIIITMAKLFTRREVIHVHGLRDRITLPLESRSTLVTMEPLISRGRIYYIIEITDRKDIASITSREREIQNLIRQGCTNRDIARILNISPETVKRHLYNLFQKTGVKNRTELSHLVL